MLLICVLAALWRCWYGWQLVNGMERKEPGRLELAGSHVLLCGEYILYPSVR